MRKTICMLLAILTCFSFCTPSFAMEKVYLNAQESMVIDTYNEYDEIIKIRNMTEQERKAIGVSPAQNDYICSNAIEEEFAYRATLSDDELKNHYCYTEQQIEILRNYSGEKLELSPQMRSVAATMNTSIGALVYGTKRMGVSYNWNWTSKPALPLGNDIVVATWEGTYLGTGSNNAALDGNSSFLNVIYYYSPTATWTETKRITTSDSDDIYRDCSKGFTFEKSINTYPVWPKEGCLFLYVNLVNQSGSADFLELAVHFAYGHSSYTASIGVSFPYSLGISFSSGVTTYGNRNIRMDTSGHIQ